MKKLTGLFAMCIAFGINHAYAKIPVVYGTLEKINEIATLPSDYDDEDGAYSLGYKYTMAHLFWVPLWQTDEGKVVAIHQGDDETWYDIDEWLDDSELRDVILSDAGVNDIAELQQMPFWDAWGGKLLVGGILLVIIAGAVMGRSGKDEEAEPAAEAETE
ncbi:MAG: hypothetical protein K2L80_10175, partial [Muribaculaceae bacterium]|nr:hypothetical protein [Muribaculaceae bacterium]